MNLPITSMRPVRGFVLCCAALITSCSTQSGGAAAPAGAAATLVVLADGAEIGVVAIGLLGTPYRFGGDDPASGFDCSGLVRHVFRAVRGQVLARRSLDIGRQGDPVPADALAAGDLVFFNTLGAAYSHVAIYLGDGRFVHAPAQRGVVRIDTMDEPYWRSRYNGARRIPAPLKLSALPPLRATVPAEPARGR